MMLKMKITEKEIQDVLDLMPVYPEYVERHELANLYYLWRDNSRTIVDRKVRLCIAELRRRGHPIIALKKGYCIMGDDPEPAIHYLNTIYSRAHKLTQQADILYGLIKGKYGDEVALRVDQLPQQPALDGVIE
jgi:hypothetical protein